MCRGDEEGMEEMGELGEMGKMMCGGHGLDDTVAGMKRQYHLAHASGPHGREWDTSRIERMEWGGTRWDGMGRDGMRRDRMRRMGWDEWDATRSGSPAHHPSRQLRIWWDLVGSGGIWWDLVGSSRIWCDLVGSGGIWCDLVGSGGIWWDLAGSAPSQPPDPGLASISLPPDGTR